MTALFARILARYLAGALVVLGLVETQDLLDLSAELAVVMGTALAAIVEAAYIFARRKGWAT